VERHTWLEKQVIWRGHCSAGIRSHQSYQRSRDSVSARFQAGKVVRVWGSDGSDPRDRRPDAGTGDRGGGGAQRRHHRPRVAIRVSRRHSETGLAQNESISDAGNPQQTAESIRSPCVPDLATFKNGALIRVARGDTTGRNEECSPSITGSAGERDGVLRQPSAGHQGPARFRGSLRVGPEKKSESTHRGEPSRASARFPRPQARLTWRRSVKRFWRD